MPARQIVISSSNRIRQRRASEYLAPLLNKSELLVLAPTRSAADDFVRALCRDRAGLYGVHRMTLIQLAATLATELAAEKNLAPISGLGVEALAGRTAHACREASELGYFGPLVGTPGFAKVLAATLGELRLESAPTDRLATAGAPGKDLARLLSRYEKELAEKSLADLAAVFSLAIEVVHRSNHRLVGPPMLLLDVSTDSMSKRKLLTALVERSPAVFATALAGDEQSIAALEAILGVNAQSLDGDADGAMMHTLPGNRSGKTQRPSQEEAGGPPSAGELRPSPQENEGGDTAQRQDTSLDRVRRYIFLTEAPPERPMDESVVFFSAPGEGAECVEIARRIQFAAQAGTAFDQMAILLRHPDAYLSLVEDALARAAIPGYFTRGTIRPDPAGRAFLGLLACAAEGLSASRFGEYLSLGQVPPLNESGGPPQPAGLWLPTEDELQWELATAPPAPLEAVTATSEPPETDQSPVVEGTLRTPFNWERLLIDAAVIGGKNRWARRLTGLEAEFRMQLEALAGDEDPQRVHLEKQLERLKHLQRFALPVIEFLDCLPKGAGWGEWLKALKRLAEMALRKPESVLAVLGELEPMDEVGPVGLNEVCQVLTPRLSLLRREPPARRYGRVFVATIGEASGRSFEIVFLPGLAEGVFPHPASEDPLLLDQYRKQLGCGLLMRSDRETGERLLLRSAAGAARSRLCVSYPRVDVAQGRARVPSFYALEVLRAAEGRLPPVRELEKRAAEAAELRPGWPAPTDPGKAIDDAEHDLAVLEPLLRKPGREVRGQGRYLLAANPNLERALRTRWKRWSKAWSSADGIVDPDPATLEILATQRMSARSYSPSALQQFAACPYRFLLYAIHRLRPRQEAVAIEQLDPLTRGALFHEAQFRIFRELEGAHLLPIREENIAQALTIADDALERLAAEYKEKLAPAIPRVWESEVEELRTDLRGWIRQRVRSGADWIPAHFEFAFGLPRRPEQDQASVPEEAVILNGVRLRGSIDLIERHQSRDALRVIDHKTGKAPNKPPVWVGEGKVLQPLLYGLAAEKLLGQKTESGVLFYSTQRGNYAQHLIELSAAALDRIKLVMNIIDAAIEKGFLPAHPEHGACEHCDYRLVCGSQEERRTKAKRQDRPELDALSNLRSQP